MMDVTSPKSLLAQAALEIKRLRSKVDELTSAAAEPIAIVGRAGRFPSADSVEELWDALREGRDQTSEVPADRWDARAFYDPRPDAPGKMYMVRGGFMRRIDEFDAAFFNISPREAAAMDPAHRVFLEASWEALEDAAIAADGLPKRTGVYAGVTVSEYTLRALDFDTADAYTAMGGALSFTAGRVAYALGIHGPAVSIDTACSSSLVAVHLACQALRSREIDVGLAGGVSVIVAPFPSMLLCKMRALSPDGRCKTFDASADGYGRGEGCGIVVLKRLRDAIDAGDPVRAVILGSAVNQDGASSGITVPNGNAQEAVIREALSNAKVDPLEVGYVEAHGTGTPLGDPIEVRALAAALCRERGPEKPLLVGSLKTNIGHLEPAAGIAGLLKVVHSIEERAIPPSIHSRQPNPRIPWGDLPIAVPRALTRWDVEQGRRRVAGVSSFGASGTNAHVIVAEAPSAPARASIGDATRDRPGPWLLPLSARSPAALADLARRHHAFLEAHPGVAIRDVAFTLSAGRRHFEYRDHVLAESLDGARAGLLAVAERSGARRPAQRPPKTAFMFTGQGSVHPGMGRQLFEREGAFRDAFLRCDAIARPAFGESLVSYLRDVDDRDALQRTSVAQPLLFSFEYALASLWASWGIEPDAVVGHSLGEYVAATVAGVFTPEVALGLVIERGKLVEEARIDGEMAVIFAAEADVKRVLERHGGELSIASIHGPSEVVISGPRRAVVAALAELESVGVATRPLGIRYAFHSAMMDGVVRRFERSLERAAMTEPRIALASNVTGKLVARGEMARPDYWARQLRSAVRFMDCVVALRERGVTHFVEIGPKATLTAMGRRCLPDPAVSWLPSLRNDGAERRRMLETLGALYDAGHRVAFCGVTGGETPVKLALPTYPFQRRRHWRDVAPPATSIAAQTPAPVDPRRPLFGAVLPRTALPERVVESTLDPSVITGLREHLVHGRRVVFGTLLIQTMLAAHRQCEGPVPGAIEIGELAFHHPMFIDAPARVQIVLSPTEKRRTPFQIFSLAQGEGDGRWTAHAAGVVIELEASADGAERLQPIDIQSRCRHRPSRDDFYLLWRDDEQMVGESFRLIEELWVGDGEALAKLRPASPPELANAASIDEYDALLIDAYATEAASHVLKAVMPDAPAEGGGRAVFVAASAARVRRVAVGTPYWSHAKVLLSDGERLVADLRIADRNGAVLWSQEGLTLHRIDAGALARDARPARSMTISAPDIRGASPDSRRQLVLDYLIALLGVVLGVPAREVDPARPTRELGMDSLMATELKQAVERDLHIAWSMADLLQGASVHDLAERILALVGPPASGAAPPARPERASRWIVPIRPAANPRARLFGFPYGGGGASVFRRWSERIPDWLDLYAFQLPGREDRLAEPAFDDMGKLLPLLLRETSAFDDGVPFVFYGCSMGALIAFELSRRLRDEGRPGPERLFLAASMPPHLPNPFADVTDPTATRRGEALLPPSIRENEALMAVMGPTLRADGALVGAWRSPPGEPLDCPITAFGGAEDLHIRPEAISEWRVYTRGPFVAHVLPGGHLFMDSHRDELLAVIGRELLARYGEDV